MRKKVSKILKYLQIRLIVFFLIFFPVFESHADEDLGKIGISFNFPIKEKGAEIIYAHYLAPAYVAGLRAGDMITHIDGLEIINSHLTQEEIIDKIIGPINTVVKLTIIREQQKSNFDIIRRDLTLLDNAFDFIIKSQPADPKKARSIYPDLADENDIFVRIEYLKNALDFLFQYRKMIKKNHHNYIEKEMASLDHEIASVQYILSYHYETINKTKDAEELFVAAYDKLSSVYEKFPNLILNEGSYFWHQNFTLYFVLSIRYSHHVSSNNRNYDTFENINKLNILSELIDIKIKETKNENELLKLKSYKGDVFETLSYIYSWSQNKKELVLHYLLEAEKIFLETNYMNDVNYIRSEIADFYLRGKKPNYNKAATYFKKVIEEDKYNFQAQFELGRIYIDYLDKWDEGIAYLTKSKESLNFYLDNFPVNVQREILDLEIKIFDYPVYAYLEQAHPNYVEKGLSMFDGQRNIVGQKYYNKEIKITDTDIEQFQKNIADDSIVIRYMTLNDSNRYMPEKNEIRAIRAIKIQKNKLTPITLEKKLDNLIFFIEKEFDSIFNANILNETAAKKTITIENIILSEEQKSFFEEYRNYKKPKAFAINPYGAFGYYYGTLDLSSAKENALNYCNLNVTIGGTACKIYAVNDKIAENDNIYELKSYGDLTRDEKLFKIIKYYRSLIAKPKKTNDEKNKQHKLSKWIYSAIVEPVIGSRRENRDNLIIVPDSIFYLLPFETLIDHNNKYLVENYNIYYLNTLQSLNIFHNKETTNKNNSLLAFGGAKYNANSKKIQSIALDSILKPQEIAQMNSQISNNIDNDISIRGEYEKLGIKNWPNLPGTLDEVNNISNYFQNSKILTDEKVSENTIKAMSKNGELQKYKIIHFATHGFVHSDIPEFSALVLSQIQESDEDGYLNLKEISNLKLNSDLVVLSACNTGVGRLYHGGGVINISNAFFNAGTNAVMMSLWYLADDTTSLFMSKLYKKISTKKYSYVKALNEVKREFIEGKHGNNNKDPFFWAPVVYYGLDQ